MGIRNSSLSVSRRRRLMGEDAGGVTPTSSSTSTRTSSKSSQRKRYSTNALESLNIRITDLIPVRSWHLTVIFLLGLTAVMSVIALYTQHANWSGALTRQATAWIDLRGPANIGSWLSTIMLLIASAFTLLAFLVRQHRADDYRGRYSVLLWASAAFFLASIDATAGLNRFVQGLMIAASGAVDHSDNGNSWIVFYSLIYGTLACRLIIETRSSRGTVSALVGAGCFYTVAVIFRSDMIPLDGGRLHAMAESTARLLGHLLLMFSTIVYARHVVLDARGLLKVPRKKPRSATGKKSRTAAKKSEEKPKRGRRPRVAIHVDQEDEQEELPESPKTRRSSRTKSKQKLNREDADKEFDETPTEDPDILQVPEDRLSKSDRKRLRKEKRKQRRAA